MIIESLQYFGTSLGMLGMGLLTLAPNSAKLALVVLTVATISMMVYGFSTRQWSIGVSQTIYTIMNIGGLDKRKEPNEKS